MSVKKTTIAILDDHPIVIEGLKSLFQNYNPAFEVHTFDSAKALFDFTKCSPHIDVLLLDINLPDDNGVNVCKKIRNQLPSVKIVALSNQMEQSIIRQIFDNGACGFLLKSTPSATITSSIQAVLQGQIAIDPEVMSILTTPIQSKPYPAITKREKQLIELLAKGKTTAAIAEELFLSKFTVDTYRKNLLHKFKVKNTSELLMLLVQENIV